MADEAVVRIVLSDEGRAPQRARREVEPPYAPPPTTNAASSRPPSSTNAAVSPQRDWVKDLVQGIEGANRHVLIEGQSGSGKSMLTRHLAFQRMEAGEEVNVVDVHNPEKWLGASRIFQGESAGPQAAKFMFEALKSRKEEAEAAKMRGTMPDFKPMTIVLSDFARLMRDTPQLRDEFKTLLTEARKFRISIVADTTALTGASSGIKGIQDVLQNFGQKVKMYAPTAEDAQRRAKIAGETFETPKLPEYLEKVDFGLVKPGAEGPAMPVGPAAAARRRFEKEKYDAEVEAEYRKLNPPNREQEAAESHARLLARVAQMDRQASAAATDRLHKRVEELDKETEAQQKAEVDIASSRARLMLRVAQLDKEAEDRKKRKEESTPEFKARERYKREQESKKTDEAYKQMYGEDGASLKSLLNVASGFRGTIGGLAGTAVGAGMDMASAAQSAAVGGIGAAAGPVVAAVTALATAIKMAIGELDAAVNKYAELNPTVAYAQAVAEVKDITANLQRGERYGKELASFAASQQQMMQKFEDAKMRFLAKVEPSIEVVMEWLGTMAESLQFLTGNETGVKELLEMLRGGVFELLSYVQRKEAEEDRNRLHDPADDIYEGDPGALMPEQGVEF